MEILDTMFKGLITLSISTFMMDCSVYNIKSMAIEVHKKGPMSYKHYTKSLVDQNLRPDAVWY